ncbi:hypothetical protein SCALM49S_09657 [Streptomyces californicus]
MERRSPAQGFLLGLRAVEVAAAGIAGRGEVEDGDPAGRLTGHPAGRGQTALAGDLEARDAVGVQGRDVHRVRAVEPGPGQGGGHGAFDGHLLACRVAVPAGRDGLFRGARDAAQPCAHVRSPVWCIRGMVRGNSGLGRNRVFVARGRPCAISGYGFRW